jgi:hypothetical protein
VSGYCGWKAPGLLKKSGKPCPPAPEPSPDNIDTYRVLAAIRDQQNLTAVSILTDEYASKYPTEFLTSSVQVDIGIAGYIYSIKPR